MENHPIPQDITGFQFKLIGNLSVRQFVYFAVGGVFAWLFFFMLGLPTIIKLPLAILSLGIGAMFAFIPIDGRPMDTMVINFIRAIISPTQFVYQKEGGKITNQNLPLSQPLKLQSEMTKAQSPIPIKTPDPQPVQQINTMQQLAQTAPIAPAFQTSSITPPQPPAPQPVQLSVTQPAQPFSIPQSFPAQASIMTIEEDDESKDYKKKNKELEEALEEQNKLKREIEELKKQLEEANKAKNEAIAALKTQPAQLTSPIQVTPVSPSQVELEKQLIESNRQREALEKQILSERAQAASATQQKVNPIVAAPPPTQRVRSVPPGMEKSVGIPSVPENPNLITGIVKDPRGNPLQNILIEVKDQDSNPVRAFKTNGLGKFASATSLSNGKYLITFEDTKEQHKFDAVEIELVGNPVMPLEIISVDPREELRRELFK